MKYGVCNLSIVPLRAEASDRSEMLSQLLFGDCFEILERTEKWVLIKTSFDEYQGWIDSKQFLEIDLEVFNSLSSLETSLAPEVFQSVTKKSSFQRLLLVAGSSIPPLTENEFSFSEEIYSFENPPVFSDSFQFHNLIESYAKSFLNAPYLWGGKSMFGIDCSGFTQVVFKMLGIKLKRDAWQQAEQGETVSFLQESRIGDLAFFDNAEGRITHVGIMLNSHQIIHASGRVKIDPIDDQGIFSLDLKKHSHKLRIIKRYV